MRAEEAGALERLWHERGAKMWRSLLEFTGEPDLASDALAEAFAQALARGDAIRDAERWIWRASFKIAAGELQRRRATVAADPRAGPAELPEPVADIVAALRRLSPNQRAAAVLHDYADLPTRDVARIVGCSQATVRVHLAQARRRLRELLKDDDDA
ncbi:MAG: RNA polymerase sigma factor [Planctomycetaceae bacterium]